MRQAVGFALVLDPLPERSKTSSGHFSSDRRAARLQPTGDVRPTIPGMPVPVFTGRGPGRSALS